MNTSQKHWLEPVLSRELAAVEAPASLRVAVLYARHEGRITSRKFMWAGAALAAGVFGVVFGVVIHTQSFTERGSAANTINLFSQKYAGAGRYQSGAIQRGPAICAIPIYRLSEYTEVEVHQLLVTLRVPGRHSLA